ncbi:hypothetical protein AB0B21_33380 [Streptomyces rimosus]|uniref:hypothetical protein n=1 Tax=Streptomyces rimosus TaxID=1927 RepID=UPI000518EB5F|nr:hypothetical protein [Streptomyces rimosus]
MTVTDEITGQQLTESLLKGVGNKQMWAATRLLGAHRDGYWLRRLLDEARLSVAVETVIERSGRHPSVDWDTLGHLLLARPRALKCSSSELAVLEVTASLVFCCRVSSARCSGP